MKSQNKLLWASFLPALAYWYLEENYSIEVALIGGLCLSLLEMLLEWLFTKHIHTLSKFNFFLILILGTISLIFREGIWFKLQPMFTGLLMGGYLLNRVVKNKSLMLEMMTLMGQNKLPASFIVKLERDMAYFLMGYGLFMLPVALYATTSQWLFFKTAGFYAASILVFVYEFWWLKRNLGKI